MMIHAVCPRATVLGLEFGHVPIFWHLDSKQLEYGCRMIFADLPSFFCLGTRGRSYSKILASTVLWNDAGSSFSLSMRYDLHDPNPVYSPFDDNTEM